MDNWIDLTNYGIAVAGLMVVLMGLIMSIFSRYQEKWNQIFFIRLFSFLTIYVSFDLLSQISLTMFDAPAASISSCEGCPLAIPPKSLKGPNVSKPRQLYSPQISYCLCRTIVRLS